MPQTNLNKGEPHGEKEQMTEPQDEFISQEAVPSKDISEVSPEEKPSAADETGSGASAGA